MTHRDFGGELDKVHVQDLRHERETPRRADVALDNLHVVALRNELNIEWTIQLERACDLLRNFFDPAHSLEIRPLRREHECSVTGMDTRVFYVLANRPQSELAATGDGIHLELSRVFHELTYHQRIL